ncbi:unnamed protein product [Effrenium voratum]|nr:unnamed protein product [Effrenium voratum]
MDDGWLPPESESEDSEATRGVFAERQLGLKLSRWADSLGWFCGHGTDIKCCAKLCQLRQSSRDSQAPASDADVPDYGDVYTQQRGREQAPQDWLLSYEHFVAQGWRRFFPEPCCILDLGCGDSESSCRKPTMMAFTTL